jgi:hypothetical protein
MLYLAKGVPATFCGLLNAKLSLVALKTIIPLTYEN